MRTLRKPTKGMMMALGALFLCTPFYLDASAPRNALSISTSARVTRGQVGKIKVAARLDHGARDQLRVQLTAVNPTDKPAVARVRVDVFERQPSSRFARMVPPPMERGNATLEIRLKPRERLVKVVPVTRRGKAVTLAKRSLRRTWLSVRAAPRARKAHASRNRRIPPRPQQVAAR